jgi:ABC-type amino acid transport/signal transduction systems, periplasmic component/domain
MKTTKRILLLALAVAMLFTLAACGKKAPENRLEQIIADGKLTVAVSPDFAPLEFVDPDKQGQEQYAGAEMAMARYIADKLGVKLEIQTMEFDACQTAVAGGLVDLSLSGYSFTPERAENMELSDFYNLNDVDEYTQGVMVLAGQESTFNTAESFDGKKVAAQNASLQQTLTTTYLTGAELELVVTVQDGVNLLLTGRVDAVAMEVGAGAIYIGNNTGLAMADFVFDFSDTGTVLAAPKGETELIEAMNVIIAEINEQGLFAQWMDEAIARALELGIEVYD